MTSFSYQGQKDDWYNCPEAGAGAHFIKCRGFTFSRPKKNVPFAVDVVRIRPITSMGKESQQCYMEIPSDKVESFIGQLRDAANRQ